MAKKHLVKCKFCGEIFDTNNEEFVKPTSNRYAHKSCYEKTLKEKTQEELDREDLENYIKQLLHISQLTPKINKQIKTFREENNYSYSGIKRCLIYFYEIQRNDIEKANGGIGIVPWVWDQAYTYFYSLWIAQQKNENKTIESYKPKNIEIVIPPPQRKPKKRKLFSFLDKEE